MRSRRHLAHTATSNPLARIGATRLIGVLATAILAILSGCTSNVPWQSQPNFGSPWNNPPGAALPPPNGYPGLVQPGTPGATLSPPGTAPLPSVPALPAPNSGFSTPPQQVPPASNPNLGTNWSTPGTIQQQQRRATQFDPYANNDAAPEIVGGRPREFQKPLAEPVRARGFRDTRWPF